MLLAEDLKKSVLQAAIQGNLVEQHVSDSNVDDLIEAVQVERNYLVKEKIIKKPQKFSPITEEEIRHDIPDSWRWVRLGDICDVRDGTHDSPRYVSESDYVLITSKNIKNGKLDFSTAKHISKEDYEKINLRSKVDIGDILLPMIGTVGNPLIVVESNNKFAIKNVALFKFHSTKIINNVFLYYLLVFLESDLKNKASGGVQSFVSLTFLRQYVVPLPPLEEQKRIVDKIEKVMKEIDQYEVLEKELQSLKQVFPEDIKKSLLQAAIQGKLVEQHDSDGDVDELIKSINTERERLIKEK